MSTVGQAVGGIVGGVAGFFIGGPTGALYGAQLGLLAGGYLDPPKGPSVRGPRLDDLTYQSSAYGQVIPRVYGYVTVTGNVVWLEGNAIKETITRSKTSSGGKGGKSKAKTTTYSYSATFAVALCKGPIVGVRRIWVGPDLYYDAGATDAESVVASNQAATNFALYLGTDTQAANYRIQADKGAANTPAWRGVAYLVFYDLPLARYGNSLAGAQVKVELLQTGYTVTYPYTTSTVSNTAYMPMAFDGNVFCAVRRDYHVAIYSADGVNWTEVTFATSGTASYRGVASDGAGTLLIYGIKSQGVFRSTDGGLSWSQHFFPGPLTGYVTHIVHNGDGWLAVAENGLGSSPYYTSEDGIAWNEQLHGFGLGTNPNRTLTWHATSGKWYLLHNGGDPTKGVYASATGLGASWSLVRARGAETWATAENVAVHNGRILYSLDSDLGSSILYSDDGVTWTLVGVPHRYQSMLSDGLNFWACGGTAGATAKADYSPTGIDSWTTWTGPDPVNNQYGAYGKSLLAFVPTSGSVGYIITKTFAAGVPATLGSVVSSECLASGLLSAADLDVTALTQSVRGYRIGSLGSIRSAIEPLQAIFPFDVRQHGYKIQFVLRGGSAVGSAPLADLDARADGQEAGARITITREMDSQLPRRVSVRHLDLDREYDVGEQYAERLVTPATNQVLIDVPIVLTAAEAAVAAEVLLFLFWLERHETAFRLPPTYLHLECADVIAVATDSGSVDIRLTEIRYTADGRLECRGKYARAAVYTGTAPGVSGAVTGPSTIGSAGVTRFHLLDIPRVTSAQDGYVLLAAGYGTTAGWPGGVIMQSVDGGGNWYQVAEFDRPGPTVGTASNALSAPADARLVDKAGVLTVTLSSGDLYSVSEASLLAGENHFAYGVNGRWEIVAAQTCTLVSGSTYTLTNFLRGRFGTEAEMSLHVGGDAIVLLSASDVQALSMASSAVSVPYLYRGITSGEDIGSDSNHTFTYAAVNLRPLSPVYATGYKDAVSGDWWTSWMRRTRSGGEWRDYVDADLGETSEQYQVDVCSDGTYASVKRTLEVTTASATYTAAQQTADFGAGQTTLYLAIYQLSATVGRGRALKVTLSG